MHFKKIIINNFLSIEEAIIEFSPGVHMIDGVNEDMASEGEVESNGSGKSAIFSAIEWALYGSMSRGKFTEDSVVNRFVGKDCLVSVNFEHGGRDFVVTRTRKHTIYSNTLLLWVDGKDNTQHRVKDTETKLAEILPVSYDIFRYSILVGQGFPDKFLDLSESSKQDLLCRIVDLGVYDKALEVAKSVVVEEDRKTAIASTSLDSLQSQIRKWEEELVGYRKALEAYQTQNSASVEQIKLQEDHLAGQIVALNTTISNNLLEAEHLKAESYESLVGMAGEQTELQAQYQFISGLDSKIKSFNHEIASLSSKLKDCPTCKRPLLDDTKGIELRVAELSIEKGVIEKEYADLSNQYGRAYDSLSVKMRAAQNLSDRATSLLSENSRLAGRISELIRRRDDLSSSLSSYEKQISQLSGRIKHTEETIAKLMVEVPLRASQLEESKKLHKHWLFWKTTIPNLRSSAVSDILEYVNKRVEHYLPYFSAGAMGMSIIQEKHGSGTRIKVDLRTPGGTYDMSSGGEKRRVDLSVYLALSDLQSASSGVRCNLMVADEIADGLSPVGVYKFLTMLRDKARRDNQAIYVITHNPAVRSSFQFDSHITVVRKDGKARIVSGVPGTL